MTAPYTGIPTTIGANTNSGLNSSAGLRVLAGAPVSQPGLLFDATGRTIGALNTAIRPWLDHEHEIHRLWWPLWDRLERAMKGGFHVTSSLRRFDWEMETGYAYAARQNQATYISFPDLFASTIAGLIHGNRPNPFEGGTLNFGTMGPVGGETRNRSKPSDADLIYYNADGIGNDGSEWDAWWLMTALKKAMAYGHVGIMEEGPTVAPSNRFELQQRRPYLVAYNPGTIWDWHIEEGVLQYVTLRFYTRRPSYRDGRFMAAPERRTYFMCRRGWTGFGTDDGYERGGWWLYGPDKRPVVTPDGRVMQGDFDWNDGDLPFHFMYGERDDGSSVLPAISRSWVMDLANLAESYMNISSAADFEAWDSAKGMEYWTNVTIDSFNLAMSKILEGSRFIPLAMNPGLNTTPPVVQDSNMGAVPAAIFDTRLNRKVQEAIMLSGVGQSADPGASGISKQMSFAELKAPRLALLTSELQTAQNTSISILEKRFRPGVAATGLVSWSTRYDIMRAMDAVKSTFETIAHLTGARSKTLAGIGARTMAKEFVGDQKDLDTIRDEIETSIQQEADVAQRLSANAVQLRAGGEMIVSAPTPGQPGGSGVPGANAGGSAGGAPPTPPGAHPAPPTPPGSPAAPHPAPSPAGSPAPSGSPGTVPLAPGTVHPAPSPAAPSGAPAGASEPVAREVSALAAQVQSLAQTVQALVDKESRESAAPAAPAAQVIPIVLPNGAGAFDLSLTRDASGAVSGGSIRPKSPPPNGA